MVNRYGKFSTTSRYRHHRCSVTKRFSKISENAGLQAWNYIKKRLQHRRFPVKFAKFLRTSSLKNICKRLLLHFTVSARSSIIDFFLYKRENVIISDRVIHKYATRRGVRDVVTRDQFHSVFKSSLLFIKCFHPVLGRTHVCSLFFMLYIVYNTHLQTKESCKPI